MKIIYHHRTQADDAQGVHIYEMVKAFRDLEHVVEIVALVKRDSENEQKTQGSSWEWITKRTPARVYELMALSYNVLGYVRLAKKIRQFGPDLLYERYSLNTFCGIWASRAFGIPLILEVNAPLAYEQNKLGKLAFKRLARFSERWICSHSTVTLVVSQVMKTMLTSSGVPAAKMNVMPNGINPKIFHPQVSGGDIRQRHGLKDNLVVGFVGWFRQWHGLEMLLEIMHEARLAEKNVRLLLVGDGPALPHLQKYVEEHRLQSAVTMTGPVARGEIPQYIAAMDIAVQPAATEYACPMKIPEYMAMAKCIIAPDQPNIREILEHGVTAALFSPNDKNALRATLLQLIDNATIRKRLGCAAYQCLFERGMLWQYNAARAVHLVHKTTRSQASSPIVAYLKSSTA
ncbi:glycosyltransferase family 4 protein [bacterium]|nr:glycosyltransferase family 4 protein [bacterium]RIK72249.1 MAG: glycosyltransferase WbuB [candidate division KSB1 bacterium]